MPKRKCDCHGKETNIKGGKICSNGHFICYSCVNDQLFGSRKLCPICKGKLK